MAHTSSNEEKMPPILSPGNSKPREAEPIVFNKRLLIAEFFSHLGLKRKKHAHLLLMWSDVENVTDTTGYCWKERGAHPWDWNQVEMSAREWHRNRLSLNVKDPSSGFPEATWEYNKLVSVRWQTAFRFIISTFWTGVWIEIGLITSMIIFQPISKRFTNF